MNQVTFILGNRNTAKTERAKEIADGRPTQIFEAENGKSIFEKNWYKEIDPATKVLIFLNVQLRELYVIAAFSTQPTLKYRSAYSASPIEIEMPDLIFTSDEITDNAIRHRSNQRIITI